MYDWLYQIIRLSQPCSHQYTYYVLLNKGAAGCISFDPSKPATLLLVPRYCYVLFRTSIQLVRTLIAPAHIPPQCPCYTQRRIQTHKFAFFPAGYLLSMLPLCALYLWARRPTNAPSSLIYFHLLMRQKLHCRDGISPVSTVDVDPHFNFHFSNAYEEDDGKIIFGTISNIRP